MENSSAMSSLCADDNLIRYPSGRWLPGQYLQSITRLDDRRESAITHTFKGHFRCECNNRECKNMALWWSCENESYYCGDCVAVYKVPAVIGNTYLSIYKNCKYPQLTVTSIRGWGDKALIGFFETHTWFSVSKFHKWIVRNKSTIEGVNPWPGNM